MATTTSQPRALPRSIRQGLRRVDRRLRGLGLLTGLGTVALVLALGAVLGMAADVAFVLPAWARWAIWGAWLAVAAVFVLRGAVGPLVRKVAWADLAAVAERKHPGLEERLTSSVALLAERPHGSPALIGALADEAASRVGDLDLTSAVSYRPAARRGALGATAIALVLMPALLRPDPFATLLRRFVAPWSDAERIGRFLLDVRPGDRVIALGSDLTIHATVRPRYGQSDAPDEAWLEWTDDRGAAQRVRMAADSVEPAQTRSFNVTLPRVANSFRYRVASGSAQSRRHRITAVEPPAVATLTATIAPPAYTKLPTSRAKNPARIEAWEGSQITLHVATNKPARAVGIEWPVTPTESSSRTTPASEKISRYVQLEATPDGKTWTATLAAASSGPYSFTLRDEYDLKNLPEPPRRLVVRPDRPPTVAVGGSGDPKEARGDDVLLVDVAARDDLAVASVELHYTIERARSEAPAETGHVVAKLAGLGTRSAKGEVALSLKTLGVKAADVVSYRVRVADNLPAPKGPNVTWSSPRSLTIADKADPLADRRDALERTELRAKLEAIKKQAAETRKETESLRYAADAAQRGNGMWDQGRAQSLAKQESAAHNLTDQLQLLAHDFAESGQFAPLERPTRQAADVEAEGSRAMLDRARRAPDAGRRLDDLKQADGRLAALQNRLDDLLRRFDALAQQDEDRRRLRVLAERQDELAARAEELAKSEDRAALEQVQQEQERLRNETEAILRRSPEFRAQALDAQRRRAADLAERARDLARRQREEARRTGDPAGRAEVLKALAEQQKAVEDDARRLAMQVDQPLQENGRGRADVDALARAVEPIERGDIAQGRERLEGGEDALRRLARDLDDVRDDPKALARRLARRQDALNRQVEEAVRDAKDVKTPEEKAALAKQLTPLAERQEAIARLAASIPVDEPQKAAARDVKRTAEAALKDLNTPRPQQVQGHQNEVRDALNRLADALPDPNQRRQQVFQRLAEARRKADEVARELDQHLRETAPRPDRAPESSFNDLAKRLTPLAQKQEEVAAELASLDVDPRAEPQRDRAARRAQNLANALDSIRDTAPTLAEPTSLKPAADWHVIGPFDMNSGAPFNVAAPVDLKAIHEGRKRARLTWRGVASGDRGVIDLAQIYSSDANQSAFGYAEVTSPSKGVGQLVVGSDDTLTVWLNGKQVYDFQGARSFNHEQARVEVELNAGVNRLVIRCGNIGAEWKYAALLKAPAAGDFARKLDRLRSSLPAAQVDARAAMDRLDQKLQGREPADDRAEELASDLSRLESGLSNPKSNPDARRVAAEEAHRVATALRNLDTPDAPLPRSEAVRAAERAARALDDPKTGDTKESAHAAAEAASALARRLTDEASPRERAAALARAERALNSPDAPRDPSTQARAQRDIADDLNRLQAEGKDAAAERVDQAAAMAERSAQPNADPNAPAEAREQAARALDELAARMARVPEPPKLDRAANPRAQAEALAQRQRDLSRQMERMRERIDRAPNKEAARTQAAEEFARLAAQEKALAEAARQLPRPRAQDEGARRNTERSQNDVRLAQRHTAEALAGRDAERAAHDARESANALDRLAHALPEKATPTPANPDDPELGLDAKNAEAARDLARRERQIRERLQALLGERVEPQERLRDEAAQLGRTLADLRDQARDLSPRSQGPAHAAADLMQNHAPQAMTQGAEQLAQGRPDPARDAQRRAAELVERAAQQIEDLAAALHADRPADAPPADPSRAEAGAEGQGQADLASARDAQREASRQLSQARDSSQGRQATQAASSSMHQAAQGLRAASQARRGPSSPSMADADPNAPPSQASPDSTTRDPKGGQPGTVAPSLAELQALVKSKTGRSWGELPGHLRTEILQMSQGRYREDYARLIQLYFQEIAADKDGSRDREARP